MFETVQFFFLILTRTFIDEQIFYKGIQPGIAPGSLLASLL